MVTHPPNIHIGADSASFFSVCSACGGVGGLIAFRSSLQASSLAIR
jgi:hypothetical protein